MSPHKTERAHSFSVIHRRTVGLRDKKEVLWIGDRYHHIGTGRQQESPSKELPVLYRFVRVIRVPACARVSRVGIPMSSRLCLAPGVFLPVHSDPASVALAWRRAAPCSTRGPS